MIQACLNGRRTTEDHPAVPITARQLAADARRVQDAGASGVHLHPRDAHARESLDARVVSAAVRAVREACPGLQISVSTGLWMGDGDVAARQAAVEGWAAAEDRPDVVSLNLGEPGFERLADTLGELGIGIEAGVWSEADAVRLLDSGRTASCSRILVEMIDLPAPRALSEADRILRRLAGAGADVPVLLHGEDECAWPVLDRALALGLETRIGLEDTLTGPDGRDAEGNAALVHCAVGRRTRVR
ncbi:3-keto-5-aminohexanoate cleavage protein [Streptomyces sp. TRM76323]|uniref:3-keto-5-aminohexanoate cleavage protein n=1 Tax=Streptomyces tamarix TaxID=3078565 RepID=A0ABU3QRX5_9ACTN|nr:3-keto-5-aminohexanoate cleavage protein [Streptomyces tamarix]MDT9685523.1 3-keto-5-aminohexanoate cleavage protein [Streptomyces tamarix]